MCTIEMIKMNFIGIKRKNIRKICREGMRNCESQEIEKKKEVTMNRMNK